jgi:DNA-binding protein HU-beta
MTKAELVDAVAEATGVSKKSAGEAVSVVFDSISSCLSRGDKVTIPGFGTFKTAARAARTGRNPQTGAEMKIPARVVPRFTAGKALKEMVN